jgi:hypothetical protein
LTKGVRWNNCLYASHGGTPWQQCAFSFTANGVTNGYSGNINRFVFLHAPPRSLRCSLRCSPLCSRIFLGLTSQPGQGCFWHNCEFERADCALNASFFAIHLILCSSPPVGAETNTRNLDNVWYNVPRKKGYIYMK